MWWVLICVVCMFSMGVGFVQECIMYGLIGKMKIVVGECDWVIVIFFDGIGVMFGCLSYVVVIDLVDLDVIWIIEVWESVDLYCVFFVLLVVQVVIVQVCLMIIGFGECFEIVLVGGYGLVSG